MTDREINKQRDKELKRIDISQLEFKPVPGHRLYIISKCGRILRNISPTARRQIVLPQFHKVKGKEYPNGYWYSNLLYRDGLNDNGEIVDYMEKQLNTGVHRIVAMAWLPNPNNFTDVNHIDGNKLNNNLDNLEWCSRADNIIHSYKVLGREIISGANHWNTGKKVNAIVRRKMSEQKKGKLHPKYKGFYCIKGNKYYSLPDAEKGSGIAKHTIRRRIKDGSDKNMWFVADPERKY